MGADGVVGGAGHDGQGQEGRALRIDAEGYVTAGAQPFGGGNDERGEPVLVAPAPFGEPPRDRVPSPPADAASGRGLGLVPHCADAWGGWAVGGGPPDRGAGKLLWFEVGGNRKDRSGALTGRPPPE
ncbi:hypothetical protein [Streptomyces rubradiris]|uniref:Uncharacterized protein n=1 Tax=Streptomyces rubradiris TaxID=285531 RepID=A0ABQ3RNF9_STRRR|nr:hypothetical protein [Streptomyces rubradiris]GHH13197.1 hypothetical protein GCM10018792_39710 [Streptomyces rubradiris]GHI57402.1 hypothetical protein Srubr_72480 [Streptomyces rubradiris]